MRPSHPFRGGRGALLLTAVLSAAACGETTAPDAGSDPAESPSTTTVAALPATSPGSCNGRIGAITVENVNVPSGATCFLEGTRVKGNVFVRTGATLRASGVRVDGNIQAEDARSVTTEAGAYVNGNIQVKRRALATISNTRVNGDVQVEEGGASLALAASTVGGNVQVKKAEAATVQGTQVDGDIQWEENRQRLIGRNNQVRGNFQVFKNRGGVELRSNRISQSLQCKENQPAPVGSGNVAGEKEDQCRRL